MHLSPGRTAPWLIWLGLPLALIAAACSGAGGEAGFVVIDPSLETRIVVVPDKSPKPLDRVVIHAVGDVLVRSDITTGADKPLSGIAGLFGNDSITIANLACAAATTGESDGPANVVCESDLLSNISRIGVDVVSVANDEAPLQGRNELLRTIASAEATGLQVVGGGAADNEAYAPSIVEVGGWRIAVLAMTAIGSNFAGPDRAGVAAVERTNKAVAAVEAAREQADLVIATVHWGRPLDRDPERRDRDYADTLINAGVDAIFGHGPHRLQSFALVDERPVFWSLGHFLWPVSEPADADSAIGRLEISPDGTLVSCLLPVTIDPASGPQLDRQDPNCNAQG